MKKSNKLLTELLKASAYTTLALALSAGIVHASTANKYDLNGDGVIDVMDLNNMKRQVLLNYNNDYPSVEESKTIVDTYLKETFSEEMYEGFDIDSVVNTKNCTIVSVSCIAGKSSCMYNLGSSCSWKDQCINHKMNKSISIFEGTSGTGVGKYSTFRLVIINGKVKGFVVDTDKYYKDTEIPVIPSEPSGDWYYKSVISDLYFESSPALYVKNFDAIENAQVTHAVSEEGNPIVEVSFYNNRCIQVSNTLTNGYIVSKSANVVFTFKDKKIISGKFV